MLNYYSSKTMTDFWEFFFSLPGTVFVCLGSDVSVHDEIMAACQALCLRNVLLNDSSLGGALKQLSNTKGEHCDKRKTFYK